LLRSYASPYTPLFRSQLHWQQDVLLRIHRGHEVERLEDEADAVAADRGEFAVAEARQRGPADDDLPGIRGVEAGEHVQQRRLARDRKSTRLNSSHVSI